MNKTIYQILKMISLLKILKLKMFETSLSN